MSDLAADVSVILAGNMLSAVLARPRRGGRGVEVLGCLVAERPAEVDGADAGAVGAWVRRELEGAKMLSAARRGVVLAVPRGEVAVKRIVVPPGASALEVPELVRLQMVRQLPIAGDEAAIDFVPINDAGVEAGAAKGSAGAPGGGAAGTAGVAGQAVLAAALPGERLAWRKKLATAAGLKASRIGLLAEGAAWLLQAGAVGRAGAVMGVVIGAGGIELVVIEHGQLMFARGIDVLRPAQAEGIEAAAGAVLVEARRTWMSYRVAAESSEIEEIVVMGDDEFAAVCAGRLGEGLEMPARMITTPGLVETPPSMSSVARAAALPLAGLLALERERAFDFLSPRRPVDVRARRRRVAMLGVLAGVVCAGTGYTWASKELASRQREIDGLRTQFENTRAKHQVYLREKARVEFLQQYMEERADWVAHLDLVTRQLPDPRQAILEKLNGTLAASVGFDLPKEGGKHYANGKWRGATAVTIEISGSSKGRSVADELRDRIQNDSTFKVETRGADVPNHYEYVLTTSIGTPGADRSKGGEGEAAKKAPGGAAPANAKGGGRP